MAASAEPSVRSGTIIIDLGLARGEPEDYESPGTAARRDWFMPALLAVFLVLGLSGSAGAARPALTALLSLEVSPADPYTVTDDGRMLVQSSGTLASYSLADGARHWETGSPTPSYRLNTGGGMLLLRTVSSSSRAAISTRAVALDTGQLRWRHPGTVVTVTGSPTLLSVSSVRSFSGEGRRVQGEVTALSPDTGATRWTVPIASTAVLLGVPGSGDEAARMLLVHDNRTAAVHDLVTGERLAVGDLPAADYGPDNPVVAGGLVLLRHPTPAGRVVSAFDVRTLEPRWSRSAGYAFGISVCGDYACLAGPDGVRAIDLTTGVQRWFQSGWRRVEARGKLLAAFGAPGGGENELTGLVNPRTGALLTDLHGWRPVTGAGGDHLLVTRTVDNGSRTMVAVASPGERQPRIFGDLPEGVGDCRSAPDRLACRSATGQLTLWAYQREG